ncbi:MAG TPA: hypothetical protein VKB55_16920 [Nocardioidaceae bacterium]|nr:hypothetical protein [Nocardioidaceae bacterium]
MKKLALTAAAALAATTLTGAAVVPAISPAAGEAKVYTKRLVSRDLATHQLTRNTFTGAAVDRREGHVVGYESFSIHFHPKQGQADIWDSFALRDGTISAVVHVRSLSDAVHHGRILNGTGKYRGARGTIAARPAPHSDRTFITLRFHL